MNRYFIHQKNQLLKTLLINQNSRDLILNKVPNIVFQIVTKT